MDPNYTTFHLFAAAVEQMNDRRARLASTTNPREVARLAAELAEHANRAAVVREMVLGVINAMGAAGIDAYDVAFDAAEQGDTMTVIQAFVEDAASR